MNKQISTTQRYLEITIFMDYYYYNEYYMYDKIKNPLSPGIISSHGFVQKKMNVIRIAKC